MKIHQLIGLIIVVYLLMVALAIIDLSMNIFLQHTFSSLLKQKSPKSNTARSKGMAVSMRDLDSAFQGAGQKAYPFTAIFL